MAFFTIFIPAGLSKRDHRRAVRVGPRAVTSSRAQSELVAAAGYIDVAETDFTDEFLDTARGWLRFSREFEGGLRAALGDDAFDEQLTSRTDTVAAIESGLLRRSLLVAVAPASPWRTLPAIEVRSVAALRPGDRRG